MMTSQTTTRETVEIPEAAGPAGGKVPRYRAVLGALILALAVAAALAAGGWGVFSSLTGEAPPARIGEDVAVSGGTLRVDAVMPEHMAPMKMGKFGQQGMNMAMPNMDMAPEGFERFAVQVSLVGQDGLEYAPEDFRISGKGVEDHEPVRSQLGADSVPDGSAVSGNLVFQAPEEAKNLTLQFDGGRGISLDLPANGDGGHGH
jgi:hypothetical protein